MESLLEKWRNDNLEALEDGKNAPWKLEGQKPKEKIRHDVTLSYFMVKTEWWESFRDFVDVCGEVEEDNLKQTSMDAVGPIVSAQCIDDKEGTPLLPHVYRGLHDWWGLCSSSDMYTTARLTQMVIAGLGAKDSRDF